MAAAAPQPVRFRVLLGVALGAVVFGALATGFTADALRRQTAGFQEREAVMALGAVTSLLQAAGGEGDDARKVAAVWQPSTPAAASLRVSRGMQLEVSTVAADAGEKAAPRRLQREEKPLYDRGQRIATSVQTNKEEQGSRKEEIEAEVVATPEGRRLSLAMPLEVVGPDGARAVVGLVELLTTPLAVVEPYDPVPSLIAGLAALAAVFGLSMVLGARKAPLAIAALAVLLAAQAFVIRGAMGKLQARGALAAQQLSKVAKEQDRIVRTVLQQYGKPAPAEGTAAAWDADSARKPRGLLVGNGEVAAPEVVKASFAQSAWELRRALYTAVGLSAALLLLSALGLLAQLASTLSKHRQAYYYIAPAIIGMLALVFYPFSYGITLSFTDSNIYNTGKPIADIWVGLKNYGAILGDFQVANPVEGGFAINYLNFYWTLLFTIIWTVTNVVLGVSSGLLLALILNTKALAFRPIYRVLLILPWAMPNYITALIWKGMFHQQFGVVNHVLQMFGLHAVNWFDHPFTSFLTALATNGWLSFPFMMVVSLGALQSIPSDLYEAARVDGASRWQSFLAITLPSLKPALVPAVILSVVWTFNMFNIIYLVTGGEPAGATEILVTQAYKFAFEKYRYGYAAAYSTVIFGILLVYGSIQNRLSKATEA